MNFEKQIENREREQGKERERKTDVKYRSVPQINTLQACRGVLYKQAQYTFIM